MRGGQRCSTSDRGCVAWGADVQSSSVHMQGHVGRCVSPGRLQSAHRFLQMLCHCTLSMLAADPSTSHPGTLHAEAADLGKLAGVGELPHTQLLRPGHRQLVVRGESFLSGRVQH